jgi:D-alanyl-D-alanine endopeptidase (penicillin-binding protein 7)
MTAAVIVDANLPMDELIEITRDDRDRLRGSRSRLGFGTVFTRHDLLQAALGASDNRAAAALARTFPGGTEAMIHAMNEKAKQLGMMQTRYADSSGLDSNNISTAQDLAKLVAVTFKQPLMQALTTNAAFSITDQRSGAQINFRNTNRLVRRDSWDIGLSKTGYTAAAGNCLVMQTTIADRPLIIVLLNSWGKYSRLGDSNRIRDWLIRAERKAQKVANTVASSQG